MKKIVLFKILLSMSLFAINDFVQDEDFFSQQIGDENEYFSDDPAIDSNPIVQPTVHYYQKEYIPDGVQKAFYSDGKLKYEISYFGGRKDGMEKIFYPDGKLKSETNYRDGRKDGMEKIFRPDGRIYSEIIYRNGRVEQQRYLGY